MLDLKRQKRTRGVIVAGCLPQRLGPALLDELPEIDHIVGVFGRDEINRVADHLIGGAREQRELFRPAPMTALDDRARLADHAAALRLSQDFGRLRPHVHVLLDSQDARETRHQADRNGDRRGARARR